MEKGYFTLPGEAGYEKLTLQMADKWGADVIRDSDGTTLSDDILNSGYDIYSTICVIRGHNEWARENPDALQQSFLMSRPVVAEKDRVTIRLLDGYRNDQFRINESAESINYWQVFDRTSDEEMTFNPALYDAKNGTLTLCNVRPFHTYTVNFLSYRIWEEINMYNHVTNNWTSEHLMPIDPRTEKAQKYLLDWMDNWCRQHPATNVVRFTSMFYNFVWIWGNDKRHENYFTDWGSYDFTVSTTALEEFAVQYGYKLTSEDFINKGKLNPNNLPPTKREFDYIEFTNSFVSTYGRKLIDIVHGYGKKAYMFYDDSWIGTEPYSELFGNFSFDGIIKCVFNGYEVRQCANVGVTTHEIRLHPYLFPTGLNGAPTFMKGGDPTTFAKKYWVSVRRALLRQSVDRIGLGGYLHLVKDFPEFCNYIENLADEFRTIRKLHMNGKPFTLPITVSVLTCWGKLRTWSLSGNYGETCMHDLLHVIEALSGLPVNVKFVSFDDIRTGDLKNTDVLINAGRQGLAWTGGSAWNDPEIISLISEWVYGGGTFLGVNEPSSIDGHETFFRMAHVLGVDEDDGSHMNHGRWSFEVEEIPGYEQLIPEKSKINARDSICLLKKGVKVLAAEDGQPTITVNAFGAGKGIYMSSFNTNNENNRLFLNLLLYAKKLPLDQFYLTQNPETECAYYPDDGVLAIINNSSGLQKTVVKTQKRTVEETLESYSTKLIKL